MLLLLLVLLCCCCCCSCCCCCCCCCFKMVVSLGVSLMLMLMLLLPKMLQHVRKYLVRVISPMASWRSRPRIERRRHLVHGIIKERGHGKERSGGADDLTQNGFGLCNRLKSRSKAKQENPPIRHTRCTICTAIWQS